MVLDQIDVHYVPTDLLTVNNTGTSHPMWKSCNGSLEDGVNEKGIIHITLKKSEPHLILGWCRQFYFPDIHLILFFSPAAFTGLEPLHLHEQTVLPCQPGLGHD